MILAHKIALDPTNAQRTYFAKACGVARLAYNWGLAEWKDQYAVGGKPSEAALRRQFNAIKRDRFPFVMEVTKCAPQHAIMHLGDAFKNFFRRIKAGEKPGFPRFKKKGVHDSFTLSNDQFDIDGFCIRIPNLGWVRMREALRFSGKIMSATIGRTAGRWFASVVMDGSESFVPKRAGSSVGIDFGCTTFATLSTGEKIEGPKPHKLMLDRLQRLNKSLHRKVLGSRSRAKAKATLARLHARIANVRRDFLHKFTTGICRRFSVIGIEDLNILGMSKNHALARSILDGAPHEMRRQLTYKAQIHGGMVAIANRFFPSSKLCSACGEKIAALKLSDREWLCASCGVAHDRDVNAAINLEKIAVSSTVTACGVSSSGAGHDGSAKLGTMKQEPNARNSVGIFG